LTITMSSVIGSAFLSLATADVAKRLTLLFRAGTRRVITKLSRHRYSIRPFRRKWLDAVTRLSRRAPVLSRGR